MTTNLTSWRHSYRYRNYLRRVSRLSNQPKFRIPGLVVITFASIYLMIVTALRPTIKTVLKLRQEVQEKQELASQLETKLRSLRLAKTNYTQVADDIYLLDEAVPLSPQVLEFLLRLFWLMDKEGLSVQAGNIGDFVLFKGGQVVKINNPDLPNSATSYAESKPVSIDFDLVLSGEYPRVKRFAESLESMDRMVRLERMKFANEGDQLSTAIAGTFYYYEKK